MARDLRATAQQVTGWMMALYDEGQLDKRMLDYALSELCLCRKGWQGQRPPQARWQPILAKASEAFWPEVASGQLTQQRLDDFVQGVLAAIQTEEVGA